MGLIFSKLKRKLVPALCYPIPIRAGFFSLDVSSFISSISPQLQHSSKGGSSLKPLGAEIVATPLTDFDYRYYYFYCFCYDDCANKYDDGDPSYEKSSIPITTINIPNAAYSRMQHAEYVQRFGLPVREYPLWRIVYLERIIQVPCEFLSFRRYRIAQQLVIQLMIMFNTQVHIKYISKKVTMQEKIQFGNIISQYKNMTYLILHFFKNINMNKYALHF